MVVLMGWLVVGCCWAAAKVARGVLSLGWAGVELGLRVESGLSQYG